MNKPRDANDVHREQGPEGVRVMHDQARPFTETKVKANGHNRQQKPPPSLIQSSAEFVKDFVPPDYLIDGVLLCGNIYSVTGKTGSGKTAVVLLKAASVGLGRNLGNRECKQGSVLYFAGENPDDVRMRWIAMSEHCGFDIDTIPVYFIPGRIKISELRQRIINEMQRVGEAVLVVIDTTAAYFEGDEANNNVQQLQHAHLLRSLTKLPGRPCVLANCHPVKNATADNLLPYGGGAFVNEMDGNLTCWIEGSAIEVHWKGKFRGPDFPPLTFSVRTVNHERLKDAKGRLIPTVIAEYLTEADQQQIQRTERSDEDKLLLVIKANGRASLADHARMCEWFTKPGEPNKMKVKRTAERLQKAKLVSKERDEWLLTDKGKKTVERLEKAERDANAPDSKTTLSSKKKKPKRLDDAALATLAARYVNRVSLPETEKDDGEQLTPADDLRSVLAGMVPRDQVEAEFARVLDMVKNNPNVGPNPDRK
jgi:hypothetical protein